MFRSLAVLGLFVMASGVVALAAIAKAQSEALPPNRDAGDKTRGLPGPVARRMPSPLYHAKFSVN